MAPYGYGSDVHYVTSCSVVIKAANRGCQNHTKAVSNSRRAWTCGSERVKLMGIDALIS